MISKRAKDRRQGFTLLEIIIALAVFAFVVSGLLAFLPWAIDGKQNIRDFNTACSMPDAIQVELDRIGFKDVEAYTRPSLTNDDDTDGAGAYSSSGGGAYSSSGGDTGSSDADDEPGLYLVARRDGLQVRLAYWVMQDGAVYKPASSDIPDHEQYFLIKCIQFSKTREATQADVTAGRAGAVGEEIANHLAHDSSNGWLALQVDVQWPYKFGPGNADDDGSGDDGSGDSKGTITAKANLREHFVYPAAITR